MQSADKKIDEFLDDKSGKLKLQSDREIDSFLEDGKNSAPTTFSEVLGAGLAKPYETGTGNPVMEALKMLGGQFNLGNANQIMGTADKPTLNPSAMLPGRMSATFSDNAARSGDAVSTELQKQGAPKYVTGPVNFATSIALDPTSYAMGGLGAKGAEAAAQGLAKGAEAVAPTVVKTMTNMSENAMKRVLETKDFFSKYAGTQPEIEKGVTNVMDTLKQVQKDAGNALGAVKDKLGISDDAATQMFNYAKQGSDAAKSGSELMAESLAFKATAKALPDAERLKQATDLAQRISDRISWANKQVNPLGTKEEGLLKMALKDLSGIMRDTDGGAEIAKVNKEYATARNLYDSLQSKMAEPGQAEALLKNVFTSDKATYKDVRRKLSLLETLSGKPVVSDLFGHFAAQEANKLVGRPFLANMLTTAGGMGALVHPVTAIPAAAGLAAQSPRVMSRVVPAAVNAVNMAANSVIPPAAGAVGAGALQGLFNRIQARSRADQITQ